MKKALSVCLCAALVLGAIPLAHAAAAKPEPSGCPVVLMPGLLENKLIRDKGEKTEKSIWFPFGRAVTVGLRNIVNIIRYLAFNDVEGIRTLAPKIVYDVVEPLRMNPDGTSYYNVSPVVSTAEESSYNALKKAHKLVQVTYGTTLLKDVAKIVGGDRAFVFQYDWRMSAIDVADDLHAFLQDVKKLTGSDKVNISGTSFGSEVLLCYLEKYGECGDLHHVLMNSPAYGGSNIFLEMLSTGDPSHINYEDVLKMLLSNYGVEAELGYLLNILPEGEVDLIFQSVTDEYIKPYLLPSVGLWGCCATKDYETAKALFLDPVKNAKMIEKTDAQQAVMARAGEILRGAERYGTKIYAIMNEGSLLVTSHDSGDVLVDGASGTGGVCLPIGEHFDDAYVPERVVCQNPAHDHVSYTGSIDLTNAYLPESTWVFYGQMHGQNYWDERAKELTMKILTTEDIRDVYSDPAFPQFSETGATVSDVSLTLQGSPESVLRPADGAVTAVLKNHSRFHAMHVKAIDVDGLPYTVSRANVLLLPGEEKTVILSPTGKTADHRYGSITLQYDEIPNLKLHKTRTQFFRLIGG